MKVSGSKGVQLYVPLNTPVSYAETQPFARTIAEFMAKQKPKLIVAEVAKHLRKGKVFIDWSQNSDFKTSVAVYSLRAKRDRPYVSVPVTWEELRDALDAQDRTLLDFELEAALKRCEDLADLFAPVLKLKQRLPKEFGASLATDTTASTRAKPPRPLKKYEARRDFSQTSEPVAAVPKRSSQGDGGGLSSRSTRPATCTITSGWRCTTC